MESTQGWGLIARRINHVIKGMELSVLSPDFGGKGEGLEVGQWSMLNQSCLCNKASVKPQKDRVWRAFVLVNTWRFGKRGMLREVMEAPCPSHITHPVHLFHLAVPLLYPFVINW